MIPDELDARVIPDRVAAAGLDVEAQVFEAFTLTAMDYHRNKLAEASARLGVLHARSPKQKRAAA